MSDSSPSGDSGSASRVEYRRAEDGRGEATKYASGPGSGRKRGCLPFALLSLAFRGALLLVLLVALPFYCLIRGGVWAYQALSLDAWSALALSAAVTMLLLVAYAWFAGRRMGAGKGVRKLLRRSAVVLASAYVAYALLYVAGANVKSEEVRAEYSSLHPMLRLAASTLVLVDRAAVITDAARTRDDYRRMGLSPREASLHFRQASGFVHAIDLRTKGRSERWNKTVELAFWAMGFHALRHMGTADHLHISLRLPE